VPVNSDPAITVINRYRAAMAELDKIAVREPTYVCAAVIET